MELTKAKSERVEAIKSQLLDPRDVRNAQELSEEMARLAKGGICAFPPGTAYEYHEAIFQAVSDGYLVLTRGTDVSRAPPKLSNEELKRPAGKPATKQQEASTQMELF